MTQKNSLDGSHVYESSSRIFSEGIKIFYDFFLLTVMTTYLVLLVLLHHITAQDMELLQ